MNVRDSEVVAGILKKAGYGLAETMENADIIIFNTCSVRQHAEDKVWSEIGRITKLGFVSPIFRAEKARNPNRGDARPMRKIIGLAGCMAQNYKEQVFERCPAVDFVVGPGDIDKIPEIIKQLSAVSFQLSAKSLFERKIWKTDGEVRPEEIYHTGFYEDKEHAYVVVSEGCSNYCSYCVVPYVRGELHNRDYKLILKEIEEAIDKGITRITLLGQNVNAYKYKEVNFVKLVNFVSLVKGLKEFSFITSHPKDTSIELFKAMSELEKIKKCLHLPIQSGSDRILKLMNRGYTRKFYLDLADNYRKIVKGGILTTDIIVGFPGETKEDFQDTYDLVKAVRFDCAYIFKYSPRPNTAALSWFDDVAKEEKEKRHSLILELQKEISRDKKADKK